MVDNYGAKHFFHHSHVGLHFRSSAYCYFFALCLFHSVLCSVCILAELRIITWSTFYTRSAVRVRSPCFILTACKIKRIPRGHPLVQYPLSRPLRIAAAVDFLPSNRRRWNSTTLTLTFNNNSDVRMSNSPAYPP